LKINSLQIQNFKALRGSREYEFPEGIIGIVGPNGQGKSNLTRAIAWALYGPLVYEKGLSGADTISWGEKEAHVLLSFTAGDYGDLSVLRQQGKVGTGAELWSHPDNNMIASGSDAVTRTISDILGIDRVGFLASVFSRQKDLEGLSSLSTPERTKTVLRLRGLDQVTKAIESVGEVGREAKKTLTVIRGSFTPRPISEYDAELRRLTKVKSEHEDLIETFTVRENERQQEVSSLAAQQTALATQREAYLSYISAKASASASLRAAQDTLESAKRLAPDEPPYSRRPVVPAVTFNAKKYNTLVSRQATDREYIRTLNATIDAEVHCLACGRPFDNAEELAQMKAQAEKFKAQTTKAITERATKIMDLEAAKQAEEQYERAIRDYYVEVKDWESRRDAVGAAEKAVETAQARLREIVPVEDVSGAYDILSAKIRTAQENLGRTQMQRATTLAEIRSLNAQIESLTAERSRAQELVDKVASLETDVLEHEVSASLLKEFKSSQTATLIPDITVRASDYLSQLTDGKYSELVLTPEWDIQYRYEDGNLKAFPNLSVGERNVFAFALRLALAELQAGKIGILVLDEILDALDEDRQNLAWGLVEGLLHRYHQIFMVTHVPFFKERASYSIQL
jgi:DNA repair exonuclease SbcCD ATPase subunit